MKIIAKDRQKGKTNGLIELSAEMNIPILCTTTANRDIIRKIAIERGIDIPEPLCIDYRSFGFRERLAKYRNIIVDDADYLLQQLLGTNIYALSITTKEDKGE